VRNFNNNPARWGTRRRLLALPSSPTLRCSARRPGAFSDLHQTKSMIWTWGGSGEMGNVFSSPGGVSRYTSY
jgi:hypothetical protein